MIRAARPALLGFLAAALLLAGCRAGLSPTPTATSAPQADPLDGRQWDLLTMKGQPPLPETAITLNFVDSTLGGTAGCNRYGASYRLEGNRLKLADMPAVTAMLCTTPAGVMNQEQAYVDLLTEIAFTNAATFRIVPDAAGDRLEIGDALGVPLLTYRVRPAFAMNPSALSGTAWRLVSLEGAPMHAAGLTFSFWNEREFSGFTGCRYVYASYQAREDRISFPFSEMIGQDCHENERLNLQESTVTDALSRVTSYHLVAGSRLDLRTEQGGVISFLAAEEMITRLEDAVWHLAAIFGPSVDPQMFHRLSVGPLPGSSITLEFDGQRASGSAGCNEYFAPYTADGDRLAIESAVTTDMHCTQPEDVMRQEAAFLRLLPEIHAYRVLGGQLWLESDGGLALLLIPRETGP